MQQNGIDYELMQAIKRDNQGRFYFEGSSKEFDTEQECIQAYNAYKMSKIFPWVDLWYIQDARG